jgi:hypothetical protein
MREKTRLRLAQTIPKKVLEWMDVSQQRKSMRDVLLLPGNVKS